MKYLVYFSLAGLVLLSGCTGGVWVGSSSTKPNMNAATVTQYRNDAPNYEVLGLVTAQCESISVLGVYAGGTDGHALLWREALKKYPEATGIKDISQTNDFINILWFIYTDVKTTYYGTAVKEITAEK